MKPLYCIIALLILSAIDAKPQKEFNNWIFGYGTGFTFNEYVNGHPRLFDSNEISKDYHKTGAHDYYASSVSVSDKNGNLMFYSDGRRIFNRKHQVMPNGEYDSPGISITAVPSPTDINKYYIFYLKYKYSGFSRVMYSVIDMSADGFYGDIIEKDIELVDNYTGAGILTKVNFFEVLTTNDGTNVIYFPNKSENGVRIIQRMTIKNDKVLLLEPYKLKKSELYNNHYLIGSSQVSSKLLLSVSRNRDTVYMLDISPNTGEITKETVLGLTDILGSLYYPQRISEFSPDGSKIYYSSRNYGDENSYHSITQYDIASKKKTLLLDKSIRDFSYRFQLGPDGKIYCGPYNHSEDTIGVIHSPNELGLACNFEKDAIPLKEGRYFISAFPKPYATNFYFNAFTNSPICEGGTLELKAVLPMYADNCTFEWFGPKGFYSTEQNPQLHGLSSANSGKYTLKISSSIGDFTKTMDVTVGALPKARIFPANDTILCYGKTMRLRAFPRDTGEVYIWSNGSTASEITVSESGDYVLISENSVGCQSFDTVKVTFIKPEPKIEAPLYICNGAPTVLRATPESSDYKYLWSTGETTSRITVTKPGTYSVTVTFLTGCVGSTAAYLYAGESPKALITTDRHVCEGLGLQLASLYQWSDYKYLWSTGETTPTITATAAGEYKLVIENTNGCLDSATIRIAPKADASIEGERCFSGTTRLKAKFPVAGHKYLWSTGETSEEIEVSSYGQYELIVENEIGCKDTSVIELFAKPTISILGDNIICPTKSVKLSADKDYASYLWLSGETTKEIEVSQAGVYELTVVDNNGCSGSSSLEVKSYQSKLEYQSHISLTTKTYKQNDIKINVENNSDENIIIESISIDNNKFEIKNYPNEIKANQTISIDLSFISQNVGIEQGKLTINTKSICDETHNINIEIDVEQGVKAKLRLPKMEVVPGDTVSVPLYASFSDDIGEQLSFRANILIKKDVFWLESASNSGDKLSIELSGNAIIGKDEKEIGHARGLVLFGKSPSSMLIQSVEWGSDGIETEIENGELIITGVCVPDLRDIVISKEPLSWIERDVFGDELEIHYSNIIKDEYEIKIYSLLGEEKVKQSINLSGSGRANISLEELPQNTYLFTISRNGTVQTSGRFIIMR